MTEARTQKKKSRYQTLLDKHGAEIFERLQADATGRGFGADAASAFARFASFDPTATDKSVPYRYLQWLCRAYLESFRDGAEGIRAEDIYKISDDLSFFHDLKKNRPHGAYEKDIYKYTAGSLADFVIRESAVETKSGTQLMKELKDEIRAETEFVYDGPEGLIIIPKTKRASCFWGQGTRWCTAATKSYNYFDLYSNSPLLIYILPSARSWRASLHSALRSLWGRGKENGDGAALKFQDHLSGGLMNAKDRRAFYLGTAPLMKLVQAAFRGPAAKKRVIECSTLPIFMVPESLRTADRCLNFLKQECSRIVFFQNFRVGRLLRHVPAALWNDPEFGKKALAYTSKAMRYIPEDRRTAAHYLAWLRWERGRTLLFKDFRVGRLLRYVPAALWRDPASFGEQAVAQTAEALRYIPENEPVTVHYLPAAYKAVRDYSENTAFFPKTRAGLLMRHVPEQIRLSDTFRKVAGEYCSRTTRCLFLPKSPVLHL